VQAVTKDIEEVLVKEQLHGYLEHNSLLKFVFS